MTSSLPSIDHKQFQTLFPFHFMLDQCMNVLEISSALSRISPKMVRGSPLASHFRLSRVGQEVLDAEFLLRQTASLIIFESLTSSLFLRMQVLLIENPKRYLFVGSPWLRKVNELKTLGIVLQDFALHDSTVDLLQVQKTQEINLDEAREAVEKLEKQKEGLEQVVEERTHALTLANKELSRAMQSKDDFLSTMSHELRTPLNAILGLSESLGENIYGELNRKQARSIETIAESGQHLLSLVNDLLDIAKIGAGKMDLDLSITSVEDVCKASLRFITGIATKKKISIELILDPNATTIYADQRRLKQMLVNLLSNAVKFTEGGGSVVLKTKSDRERNTLDISVVDSGIGISAIDIEKLFRPFTQLDSKVSRQYPGTGLGLSLVLRLAELHGGSVKVESDIGTGSRFTVSLPWSQSTTDLSPPFKNLGETNLGDASEGPLILIADDNEINLSTIGDYLLAHGFRIIQARNGLEAIKAVRDHNPELVLMDIQMPLMNGIDAIKALRTDRFFESIPILALTSRAMVGDQERCIEAGADEYHSKPVNLKQLVQTILSRLKSTKPR